jgi:hypothetical protein
VEAVMAGHTLARSVLFSPGATTTAAVGEIGRRPS